MNKYLKITSFCVVLLSVLCLAFACNETDDISTASGLTLGFSTDTVAFDTVFSAQTSITARLKVYNRHKNAVRISSIALLGGNASPFKINVSGKQSASQSFRDIELRGNDSLYVFVKVTIDPADRNNPLLFTDAIEFQTNGNLQTVQLRAVGQDVVIFKNKTLANDSTLAGEKPYLIFGNLTLEAGKTLTISAGCKLYFHANAGIVANGNLHAVGTLAQPILLRGDRLDYFSGLPYDTLSGQWNGVRLGSGTHRLEQVEMRSGKTAIAIEPSDGTAAELTILNSKIHNFDSCGIAAKNAKLTLANTQISNCAVRCIALQGGESEFTHCTVANFFHLPRRHNASVVIRNYENAENPCPATKADFANCIVFGNFENTDKDTAKDEIQLDTVPAAPFDVKFRFCLLNEKSTKINNSHFENSILTTVSQNIFVNTKTYPFDFRLIEESPARNVADLTIAQSYPKDKNGVNRLTTDGLPDLGAYEKNE